MKRRIIAIVAAVLCLGSLTAGMALAATSQPTPIPNNSYCVTFGHGPTAAGNVVEYNWDRSACPSNTYPKTIGNGDDFAADSDSFLPDIFGTGPLPNRNFSRTDWIIDDISGRYFCHFTIPNPAATIGDPTTPVIACTRES